MDKTIESLGKIVIFFFTAFLIAVFSGTLLWLIYPHIHALFPTAADSGIIARDITWWDSVCITWIFNILLKPSSSEKSKSS